MSSSPDGQERKGQALLSAVEDMLKRSGNGEVGESSKTLSVTDFELVKTLGTGMFVSIRMDGRLGSTGGERWVMMNGMMREI
jgi:hypothetical protein